jgi:hypothetical protein
MRSPPEVSTTSGAGRDPDREAPGGIGRSFRRALPEADDDALSGRGSSFDGHEGVALKHDVVGEDRCKRERSDCWTRGLERREQCDDDGCESGR